MKSFCSVLRMRICRARATLRNRRGAVIGGAAGQPILITKSNSGERSKRVGHVQLST